MLTIPEEALIAAAKELCDADGESHEHSNYYISVARAEGGPHMIDAQDWEGCPNKTECIEGNRFGKGCVEDAVQSAMGGKPWHECRCGVDCNGNPPNARQAAENEKLRAALRDIIADSFSVYAIEVARTALEEKP